MLGMLATNITFINGGMLVSFTRNSSYFVDSSHLANGDFLDLSILYYFVNILWLYEPHVGPQFTTLLFVNGFNIITTLRFGMCNNMSPPCGYLHTIHYFYPIFSVYWMNKSRICMHYIGMQDGLRMQWNLDERVCN